MCLCVHLCVCLCVWRVDGSGDLSPKPEKTEQHLLASLLQVLAEPSVPAYYFGEEWRGAMDGKPIWYPEEWPIPNHTWKDLHKEFMDPYEGLYLCSPKEQLLVHLRLNRAGATFFCQFSGYNEVFIKEMPYRFRQFLDTKTLDDVIPRDYVHVFLNRDPVKVTPSFMGLNTGLRKVPRGMGDYMQSILCVVLLQSWLCFHKFH